MGDTLKGVVLPQTGGYPYPGSGYYQHSDRGRIMSCNGSRSAWDDMSAEERKCLEERKYWCFLLSSIVTFCISMLVVVSWRVITHLFCQSKEKVTVVEEKPVLNNAKEPLLGVKGTEEGSSLPNAKEEVQIGWMTEAKD